MFFIYFKIIFCIVMLTLIILGGKIFRKDMLSPMTLNAIALIPSLMLLLVYVKAWDVDLDYITILLILFGPMLFFVLSIPFKDFKEIKIKNLGYSRISNIGKFNILIMTLVEIFSIILLFRYMISFVGSFSSISGLMLSYRYKSDYIIQAELPTITSLFRLVTVYSGFLWAYLLSLSIIEGNKKNRVLYCLNYILSLIASLTSGARGIAVLLVISFAVQLLFLFSQKKKTYVKKNHTNNKYKKIIFYLFVLFILLATQFDKFANMLGRDTSEFTSLYYLALYLSAPVKNLDLFIRNGCCGFAKNFWDNHTLSILTNYLGTQYFNIEPSNFIYPFNMVNGYNLGNVSTAYANFYYDAKMYSYFLAIAFMAIFSNFIYRKSKKNYEIYCEQIDVYVIAYSIVAFGLLFNFFANEFYNTIVNVEFIRGIILIYLVKYFLERVKFKKVKIK